MDIRIYFQKIRETECSITSEFPVVCSLETMDGGRPGVLTEVPKHTAAKLIVEGRARLADAPEVQKFYDDIRKARLEAEQADAASRVQFTVVSEHDARALRSRQRS